MFGQCQGILSTASRPINEIGTRCSTSYMYPRYTLREYKYDKNRRRGETRRTRARARFVGIASRRLHGKNFLRSRANHSLPKLYCYQLYYDQYFVAAIKYFVTVSITSASKQNNWLR